VLSGLFTFMLMVFFGWRVRAGIAATGGGVIPDEGVSIRNVFELIVEFLADLAEQNMGPEWRRWFPLVGTIFVFVLISNMIGMIPGIDGATSDCNTTFAWAIIAFAVSEYVGFRTHGFAYLNHFLGPVLFDMKLGDKTVHVRALAPLFLVLEVIAHLARVLSLGIRLLANMFADHTVVGVWLLLVPPVLPALFMGLGVLVAFLQAYVFALLTMIYIGLALEEAH
jgi:F-type H+-transporting ATPase subunit a